MHIALHDKRVQGNKGHTEVPFQVRVRGRGKAGGDFRKRRIGHLFNANNKRGGEFTGGDSHEASPKGRGTRAAGCFEPERFPVVHPKPIGKQGTQLELVIGAARHHVSYKESLRVAQIGIFQCQQRRVACQFFQGLFPVFAHGCLSNPGNEYFLHHNLFF